MVGRSSQPLYFNHSDQPVLAFIDAENAYSEHSISTSLATIPFEDATPIRTVASWKGKNTYEGDYWSATLRRHIHHESFLEREYLMDADFDPHVVALQWQPFVLKWPRGTPKHRGHVPDFFVRFDDGDGKVIDVKRPDKVEANIRQFEMTQQICEQVGWGYDVFTGLPEPQASNITFLCGFRQDRYSPASGHLAALLDAFTPETSLKTGIHRAARTTRLPKSVIHGHVLHLLWKQVLGIHVDTLLDMDSIVFAAHQVSSA